MPPPAHLPLLPPCRAPDRARSGCTAAAPPLVCIPPALLHCLLWSHAGSAAGHAGQPRCPAKHSTASSRHALSCWPPALAAHSHPLQNVVHRAKRAVPYPLLGENTLVSPAQAHMACGVARTLAAYCVAPSHEQMDRRLLDARVCTARRHSHSQCPAPSPKHRCTCF